jgi:hypothetical protein
LFVVVVVVVVVVIHVIICVCRRGLNEVLPVLLFVLCCSLLLMRFDIEIVENWEDLELSWWLLGVFDVVERRMWSWI